MKVFVDTNVWLSGRFRPGLCAELLDALLEADAQLLLCERVLAEFERIARTKLAVPPDLLARAVWFFQQYAEVLPQAKEPVPSVPDPDDAWIVAAALAARADWFVTGDKLLLEWLPPVELSMLSPRSAFDRLRSTA